MNVMKLSAVLMAAGMLIAAPAFAQTSAAPKQQTQEGGSASPIPCDRSSNPNAAGNPDCKQRTQEGGDAVQAPCDRSNNPNAPANPDCAQRTQNLTPSYGQAPVEGAEKHK